MGMFSRCWACHICRYSNGGGCIAGNGDDDYACATKEQLINRLKEHTYNKIEEIFDILSCLKIQYNYDYLAEKWKQNANYPIDWGELILKNFIKG